MNPGQFCQLESPNPHTVVVLSPPDQSGELELLLVTEDTAHEHALAVAGDDYADDAVLPHPAAVRTDRRLWVTADQLRPLDARLKPAFLARLHKQFALRETRAFSALAHAANRPGNDPLRPAFVSGSTTVPYAGRVFTEDEVAAAVGATMDFWLTLGHEGEAFQEELAATLGVKHSLLVNSGSSANLIAASAFTTHKLPDHRRIQPGDEVITVAAGFPTTVSPILQTGAVPVFIDNDPENGNARVEQLEDAFVPGKTKAVMMAHTLGNPFDIGAVLEFCQAHELWLIEDNCDALGSTYSMPTARARDLGLDHLLKIAETGTNPLIGFEGDDSATLTAPSGAWGDISTQSFYPPHHLTMGEGGAVNIIRRPPLKTYAESFRDWGRDCWCASGVDNTCGKRFGWQLGELPEGYDHKYIYSHIGYNLKPLDPQAAIGRRQLKRLPEFSQARRENWQTLRAGLDDLGEFFAFSLPTHASGWADGHFTPDGSGHHADPSWFGFMIRVRPGSPFTHSQLGRHLDEQKIGNRMLFGGNLLRQPAFVQLKRDRPDALRVAVETTGADEIMNTALFLGTYPGLSSDMLAYELDTIHKFVQSH